MTSVIPVKDSPEFRARSLIHYIDRIKNTKIDRDGLGRLKILIRGLVDLCNEKFLHESPLDVIEVPIDKVGFEINNSYHPDLKFSKVPSFVVENLEIAGRLSDQNVCIDALRVLVGYCNNIIFPRFNYGLEIKQRRLDICKPSNRLVFDQSSVNGNDNHRQRRFSCPCCKLNVHIPNRLLKETHVCKAMQCDTPTQTRRPFA